VVLEGIGQVGGVGSTQLLLQFKLDKDARVRRAAEAAFVQISARLGAGRLSIPREVEHQGRLSGTEARDGGLAFAESASAVASNLRREA
jgi:hypothetical protein